MMKRRSDLLERRIMILNTIAEKLRRQSKDDFKGRQFEAWLRRCHLNLNSDAREIFSLVD